MRTRLAVRDGTKWFEVPIAGATGQALHGSLGVEAKSLEQTRINDGGWSPERTQVDRARICRFAEWKAADSVWDTRRRGRLQARPESGSAWSAFERVLASDCWERRLPIVSNVESELAVAPER